MMMQQRQSQMSVVPKRRMNPNDIKEIRTLRQLEKVQLNFDSPRLKQAIGNLGVGEEEMVKRSKETFEKRGLDEDVINLRHKHYNARLLDLYNRVLVERRRIKAEQVREELRRGNVNGSVQGLQSPPNQQMQLSLTQVASPVASKTTKQVNQSANIGGKSASISPAVRKASENLYLTEVILGSGTTRANSKSKQLQTLSPQQAFSPAPVGKLNLSPLGLKDHSQTQMVGFNFLTTVPLEDFVEQENAKAGRLSERNTQKAAMRFEQEKMRKMNDQKLRKKLDQVLYNQKKVLEEALDTEIRAKNNERLEKIQGQRRKANWMAIVQHKQDTQRLQESDVEREKKIKKQVDLRLKEIKQSCAEEQVKQKRVKEFLMQKTKEEEQAIPFRLEACAKNLENSEQKQKQFLDQRIEQLRRRNKSLSDTFANQRSIEMMKHEQDYLNDQSKQKETQKRLRSTYKEMFEMWSDFKDQRKAQMNMNSSRINNENKAIRERNAQIRFKLKRSQNAVETFMRERDHEIMLKQELRKLREEDMRKVQDRQKKLDMKKKMDILSKEKKDEDLIHKMRSRERALCDLRYDNLVKINIDKSFVNVELDKWAQTGFGTNRSAQKSPSHAQSPRVDKIKKQIIENTKIVPKKDIDE